jgi:hypothetical protein
LDAIDKASKEAGTALITKDVPDAMFSLSPIIAIIKERYSENSALYNLVNSAQEEDPGTAKETINRAIEELKKKDGTLYQYSLGRGITWDSHTLIAELYYTMTIAFAIKDKKYLKLDESPRTFWYAKSAIEEYKQTEFTPYLFRRINDVLSLIPPPPKAVEKKERTE